MSETPSPGTAADVRRWDENRRIANAVEVRELRTTWGTPERSIAAAFALAHLWESLHGWPPEESAADRREDLAGWDRWARPRKAFSR